MISFIEIVILVVDNRQLFYVGSERRSLVIEVVFQKAGGQFQVEVLRLNNLVFLVLSSIIL